MLPAIHNSRADGRLGWPLRRIEDATGVRRETASDEVGIGRLRVRQTNGISQLPEDGVAVNTFADGNDEPRVSQRSLGVVPDLRRRELRLVVEAAEPRGGPISVASWTKSFYAAPIDFGGGVPGMQPDAG